MTLLSTGPWVLPSVSCWMEGPKRLFALPFRPNRKMVRALLIGFAMLVSTQAWSTHVLGGEMYYDKLAGNQYRITLKLYRDCGPGNANNTGFDATATIAVYDGAGAFNSVHSLPYPGEHTMEVELESPCLQAPPTICATWAEYVKVITLPPNATGYVVSYQRCCRTPTTTNLATGMLQGLTCTVRVPPAADGPNSSPRFAALPAIALCMGQDMVVDHAATDPDGDQLVYDLVTPYAGGTGNDPMPTAPAPPYPSVVWAPGYSGAYPMDGAPGLAIDPTTGALTVHPTLLGSFAVAVRVQEFRNGQLLSAVIRDLRFDVVACDAFISAVVVPQPPEGLCTGTTVVMENGSVNGATWHWDFGVPGTDADTSSLHEPTWTYADTGTYAITLIANPGWPCADTNVVSFDVHYPLDPLFIRPPILCVGAPVDLVVEGRFTSHATVAWAFGAEADPTVGTGHAVTTAFGAPGVYPVSVVVQEFGCEAGHVDTVVVHPELTLEAMVDPEGCVNTEFDFVATATAWTPITYHWDLGDGTTSAEAVLQHVYTAPGTYPVTVSASTDSGCVGTRTFTVPSGVQVYPLPRAGFMVDPQEVSLLDPVVQVKDQAEQAVTWEYTVDGEVFLAPSFTYEFKDAGWYEVTQTVVSGANCRSSATRMVFVSDHLFYAPTVFTPDGDGLNDTFLPLVTGARQYELVIMDRWGVERFRTTDPKAAWNGDGLPQGVYTYLVRIGEYGPMRKEYSGHFSLLR